MELKGSQLEHGSVIDIRAGDLTRRLPGPLDLWESCTDLFGSWLKSGHQASYVEQSQTLVPLRVGLSVLAPQCV